MTVINQIRLKEMSFEIKKTGYGICKVNGKIEEFIENWKQEDGDEQQKNTTAVISGVAR